jgi:cellulose synthase/poly-beta-1,6-N-acetylglucosamine synthase-like glycosyltransferase
MKANSQDCCCSKEIMSSAADSRPMVSVVVPAFNEAAILEKNVDLLCRYMQGLESQYRWELLIVNDGSTDNTGDVAEACANRWQQFTFCTTLITSGWGRRCDQRLQTVGEIM